MRQENFRDAHAGSGRPSPAPTVLPISVAGPVARSRRSALRRRRYLRRVICGLDWVLRRTLGVDEFSASEACLLRIACGRADWPVTLKDGIRVERGAPIAGLHLWNEHFPPLPAKGPSFAWVNRLRRQMLWSLRELACCAETHPDLQHVVAFRARIAFANRGRREKMIRIAAKFGFERIAPDRPDRLPRRIHDFFENFWLWGLVWTFNPRSLRRRNLIRQRDELWISKAVLIARFGTGASAPIDAPPTKRKPNRGRSPAATTPPGPIH